MKVHARMVIEADPEVKQMINKLKQNTGKLIKEMVVTLIRQEYKRIYSDKKVGVEYHDI